MDIAAEKPWYRQFWLWFVLAPLIATVIAGFATLIIAGAPPSLVVDDFGQIEKTVEQDQERDGRAARLGLSAQLKFDPRGADSASGVAVSLAGDAPAALRLALMHPTRDDLDQHAPLSRTGEVYSGLVTRPDSRVYVLITDVDGEWRLTGEIEPGQQSVTLRAADRR